MFFAFLAMDDGRTLIGQSSQPDTAGVEEKLSGLNSRTDSIEARLARLEEGLSALQETGEVSVRNLAEIKQLVREVSTRSPVEPMPAPADAASPDGAPISTSDAPPPLIGPMRLPPPRPAP